MIYGSVCSGIEAATAAWHPLGWEASFFSEIEKFPRAVLEHHYPDVPLHGDFTTIGKNEYEPIDLLVGGTPCQSFSVAGLRGGMDDDRGNLALEYLKLAQRLRPTWLVWENVPGVLSSSGGRDFGAFLGGLVELGYGFSYRVLDAQFFGVPQRRRRVFVIGYLGDWRPAAAVLFERHSLQGHPAPSREKGEEAARCLRGRANSSHREDSDNFVAGTIDAASGRSRGAGINPGQLVAGTLLNNDKAAGSATQQDAESGLLLPTCIAIKNTNTNQNGRHDSFEVCPTLDRAQPPAVALKPSHYTRGKDGAPSTVVPPLSAEADKGDQDPVVLALNIRGREGGATAELSGEVATALRASQGGGDKLHCLVDMVVRRLTPTECERLQGFTDGFTQIPWRNKASIDCPDGPRYKALGNSMAVPVMNWIGNRIDKVNNIFEDEALKKVLEYVDDRESRNKEVYG